MRISFPVVAFNATILLAGCGTPQDDPQNPPIRGIWTETDALKSVTVNGQRFEAPNIPDEILKALGPTDKKEEAGCIEPRLYSVEDMVERLPKKFAGKCSFEQTSSDGQKTTYTGDCDPSTFGAGTSSVSMTLDADTRADSIAVMIHLDLRMKSDTGETQMITVAEQSLFERSGSCPG